MLVSENEILSLIPQRPPMVLIDKFIFSDDNTSISGLTVDSSCVFCVEGFLSESGLVENIAQTAAAGVGYECRNQNKKAPLGFIAVIKNLEVFSLPSTGTELKTEVNVVNRVMDVTIIQGKVSSDDKIFAQCEMRIFILPLTNKF